MPESTQPGPLNVSSKIARGGAFHVAPLLLSALMAFGGVGEATKSFDLEKRKREHWAWEPLNAAAPPEVKQADLVSNEIDRFILVRLEQNGLSAAPRADKRTLLRRASFNAIGLPPTPEELREFIADESPRAFERVVDRLLNSPHFGERWARHWFDLVRYCETYGHEFDYPILNAWRYRDYVIRAFNSNLPHDRFIQEQIAGDLLENPRYTAEGHNESLTATLVNWMGQQVHSPVDLQTYELERIDNQIDVFSKAFLGMTVSCARCHDHKFDAISTKDYYSLYSVFNSSRYAQRSILPENANAENITHLAELKRAIREQLGPAAEHRVSNSSRAEEGITFAEAELGDFKQWFAEGEAAQNGHARAGDVLVNANSNTLQVLENDAFHSGLLSSKLQGALRSPTFRIEKAYVHFRAAGDDARINIVIDGFTLIRSPIYGSLKQVLKSDSPKWLTIDLSMWRGHDAYIEFADLEPADPADERRAGGYGEDGWIQVERVIFSDSKAPPSDIGKTSRPQPVPESLLGLFKEYAEIEQSLARPVYVAGFSEGTPREESIFVRGNPRIAGQLAPRGFLAAIEHSAESYRDGSGRSQLARDLTSPANPLVARVRVNWFWHHLFGRGLVASVDNFGVLGEKPSHPELLDWLALEFQKSGSNMKHIIRLMLLSSTYQMSSHSHAAAEQTNPSNTLLHRANVRRLEGEAIRDAILAVSGRLKTSMFGPPVPIYLDPFMDGRGRPGQSGPLDGDGRRSVYIEVRRNFLSPMMVAFDAPIPLSTVGRRSVSNVPAQGLILMNDPFVQQQARLWAERLVANSSESLDSRVNRVFEEALGRPPESPEPASARDFVDRHAALLGIERARVMASLELWTDFCHALFNSKEFVFIN